MRDGTFSQQDYDQAAPFSSFLPGIAGLYGKPLWCYYVNRGQAVACFGTQDKDHGIMPFQSANLHYARVEQEGFRTLVRWCGEGTEQGRPWDYFYEPFRRAVDAERTLTVMPSALRLEERAEAVGLAFAVDYTTVPGESCAALLRSVTITNTSDAVRELEWVDGFPRLIPYGLDHFASQNAPFICQGYLNIDGLDEGLAYYRFLDAPSYLHVIPDRPAGNFYFGFVEGQGELLPVVVDGDRIFGEGGSLDYPTCFARGEDLDPARQKQACMQASAFVQVRSVLAPGESTTVHTLCGCAATFARAQAFRDRALAAGWIACKREEAAREVEKIRHRFFIHSGDAILNAYVPQTFLDNVLRGGLPLTLKAGKKTHNLHVCNRVHGDLERDYNQFKLDPTYFSQGNGHYRDANQNRRNDVWFNPDVGAGNLRYFFNLLRLDGYNPMECQGVVFRLDDGVDAKALVDELVGQAPSPVQKGEGAEAQAGAPVLREKVLRVLAGAFTPGTLLEAFEAGDLDRDAWSGMLETVLACSHTEERAAFGTGFWIDHWFYCFDQLDRFAALFPDRIADVLLKDRSYSYWDDEHRVLPRSERYLLVGAKLVHQVGAPVADPAKLERLAARMRHRNQVHTGTGEVYQTNLLEKVICLILNKAATLAPSGCGIEMEAGHPGWHDSINRLPYRFGSSTSELFQLRRAVKMMLELLEGIDLPRQSWPFELVSFFDSMEGVLATFQNDCFGYWQVANDAKERFREQTWYGLRGRCIEVEGGRVVAFLRTLDALLAARCDAVRDNGTGLPATYFMHRPVEWEVQEGEDGSPLLRDGFPRVSVRAFEVEPLPLFLEAPVHALRLLGGQDAEASALCQALQESSLFDRKLRMYLLGDSLKHYGVSVGRIGMWTPGWFENENVFLHMEHKLLLSMCESGQYGRLFETMRDVMVPFQPPERYGRSPVENTSFIVSSRHPASERHGRGYLPRSSGTSAEVLDLFLRMSFGDRPFRVENGELVFELAPVLPGWMFSEREEERTLVSADETEHAIRFQAGTYAALLLGGALVVYRNPDRLPTYGDGGARVKAMQLTRQDGSGLQVEGARVAGAVAREIRDGVFCRIEVTLSSRVGVTCVE